MQTNGHSNGLEKVQLLTEPIDQWDVVAFQEKYVDKKIPLEPSTRAARYLNRLLLAQQQTSFERKIVPHAQLSDLHWQTVEKYAAGNLESKSVEQALLKQGCLAEGETGQLYPTYAGLLLFGKAPDQFLPTAEIVAVHYQGVQMTDTYTRKNLRGSLPTQIEQAEAFIAQHLQPGLQLHNLDWQESPTLPPDAVREIIVNAVVHRDYEQRGDAVRLLIFADRLELYSPGRLPGHVTVDNLLTERYSRNEVMARVLADMGYVEQLGYGLDRLVCRMAEEGLPPPQFEETDAGFKVTLFNQPAEFLAQHTDEPHMPRWRALGLYPRQIKAMNFVLAHGRMMMEDYSHLCPDTSVDKLQRDLAGLVKHNLLLKVSEGQFTYYILK